MESGCLAQASCLPNDRGGGAQSQTSRCHILGLPFLPLAFLYFTFTAPTPTCPPKPPQGPPILAPILHILPSRLNFSSLGSGCLIVNLRVAVLLGHELHACNTSFPHWGPLALSSCQAEKGHPEKVC